MKNELYTISEKTNQRLKISRKRSRHLSGAFFISIMFVFWSVSNFNISNEEHTRDLKQQFIYLLNHPEFWLFCFLVPGFMVYSVISLLYLFFTGEEIIIDKVSGLILKKGKTQMGIQEVSHLQIRKYTDSDGDIDYRLSIVSSENGKLFIDRSSNEDGIIAFAEEIGDFLNKEIKFK